MSRVQREQRCSVCKRYKKGRFFSKTQLKKAASFRTCALPHCRRLSIALQAPRRFRHELRGGPLGPVAGPGGHRAPVAAGAAAPPCSSASQAQVVKQFVKESDGALQAGRAAALAPVLGADVAGRVARLAMVPEHELRRRFPAADW